MIPDCRPVSQCRDCPREGEVRFQAVRNYGQPVDELERDWLLEPVVLCEACALMRDDIL